MSLSIFLLWLVSIPLLAHSLPAPDQARGYLLNCGAGPSEHVEIGNLKYITDEGFISVGNTTSLKNPDIMPTLKTLRHFPDRAARKYCYVIPVAKGSKYLLRTTYYYGGFDGGKEPPVFDQIVDGTTWSTVDTTEDYANGLTSYYEIVVAAAGKMMSVCLARNNKTVSNPFISALEVEYLEDYMYNTTDFTKYGLITVARSTFGGEDLISYPDDKFNRFWQPFLSNHPVVTSHSNITSSDFWNVPPAKAFNTAFTASKGKALHLLWPPVPLPRTCYYISLYFQDNRSPSLDSWRVFTVSLNGKNFYTDLNATTNGVTVYSTQWPLSGQAEFVLTPADGMTVGPVINAGEIYQIVPLGGRTATRDVKAMEDFARSLNNPPSDWEGDPCLPAQNSWTGVSCSMGNYARVVSVTLPNRGLSGSLPSSIGKLTALAHLWLGENKLSGTIPDMSSMKELQTLHLENNQFEGSVPASLGLLPKIKEIFLQNNNLGGKVPATLKREGLNLKLFPGNNQLQS